MKTTFPPRQYDEASGQAAYALMVSLLDALATKTDLLTSGELGLIVEGALRRLPTSPHPIDEHAREMVASLRGMSKKPERAR